MSDLPNFRIREAVRSDTDAVKRILNEVMQEYALRPDPTGVDRDLNDIASSYQTSGGTFRVVESTRHGVVGCGGLFPIEPGMFELRKMYMLPVARGRGLGKQMLGGFIEYALERGASRITLETASNLKEAIGLYQSFGFVRVTRSGMTSRCDQAWELRIDSL